jgi:hypothetical protein
MIGIGLVAVEYGDTYRYIKPALKSVEYWSLKYPVLVWTNQPEMFKDKKCTVITYTEKKFNYHDKLKLLEALSIDYELSFVFDSNKIPPTSIIFNESDFESGLHSPQYWNITWNELIQHRDINGNCYWDKWDKELKISEKPYIPIPIYEGALGLKRHNKFGEYVKLVENKYKPLSTTNDRDLAMIDPNHKKVIENAEGRAEGFSFILAGLEMNFPIFCPSAPLYKVITQFKYEIPNNSK